MVAMPSPCHRPAGGAPARARLGRSADPIDAMSPTGRSTPTCESSMPLEGTYEPSPDAWSRGQVEQILESGTTASVNVQGRDVVLVTIRGAKSGKLRRTPLMRVEH